MAAPLPKTGDRVLTLTDTFVATKLASSFFPVRGSNSFGIGVEWQADSIAAGNTFAMKVEWYSDKTTLLSTQTLLDTEAAAVNTWERFSGFADAPETARWAKITLEKTINVYNVYIDRINFQVDTSEALDVFIGTTVIIGVFDETYNQLAYDTENFDRGDNFDTTTFTWTTSVPGRYVVRAFVRLASASIPFVILEGRVRIRLNGTSTVIEGIVTGNTTISVDVDTGDATLSLDIGDQLIVEGWGRITGEGDSVQAIQGDGVSNFTVSKVS